jgi:DNA-binding transcriptional regulator YiaG
MANMTAADLKHRRDRLGLTQSELAERLGVTWNTVARWETDQRRIPELAVRLLDCLQREQRRRTPAREKRG